MALPHENVTWFATKVELGESGAIKAPETPKRTEQMDRAGLEKYLQENLKNWGDLGTEAMKAFLL